MEVIAIASAVCSVCQAIHLWIEQHEEKHATVARISATVLQIHNIIQPFSSTEFDGTGEQQLTDCIRAVGDVLQRTQDHLLAWGSKRSLKLIAFLSPNALIKELKGDEEHLNHQLIILLTSVAVVGYFRDHARDSIAVFGSASLPPYSPLDDLVDIEAKQFWIDYIGAKITFTNTAIFCERLNIWAEGTLSKFICDRIVMRLDEFESGGVTPDNLARVLGDGTLRDFVAHCKSKDKPPAIDQSLVRVAPGKTLKTPLLVMIDDSPENVAYEVGHAKKLGVQVVELTSTSMAKAWVEANSAFLRENDNAARVRFISDNVRPNVGGEGLDPSAGKSFLRYLRGRFFNAPVLVFTGRSIDSTRYVESYTSAGSTTSSAVCFRYIDSLAQRSEADNSWCGYDVY